MESAEEDGIVIVKLQQDEDLLSSLEMVCERHRINSGIILSGIGMLKGAEIGYFNGREYIKKRFPEPLELVSLIGSIAYGKERTIHLHCALADEEHKLIGGHLFKGTVNVINEITILKLNKMTLRRELNESRGLMELVIRQ